MVTREHATPFSISVSEVGDGIIAELHGELDMATAPEVIDHVKPFASCVNRVIYELRNTSFIDSAGVEGLFAGLGNDGAVLIRNPSRQVRWLLELLELESSIET